jgi:hypothetical protein
MQPQRATLKVPLVSQISQMSNSMQSLNRLKNARVSAFSLNRKF